MSAQSSPPSQNPTPAANLSGPPSEVTGFVERWRNSGGAERANYALFLAELCDVLGVPRPQPAMADNGENDYVFERTVTFQNGDGTTSTGFIDLYKRGCFVLEAKQGSEQAKADPNAALGLPKAKRKKGTAIRGTQGWDAAMLAARGQAEQYARALPADEGWPPFVVVVDVGHSVELYADFTRSGKTYIPFPDPRSHRLALDRLTEAEVRERLRAVWTDPLTLDPSRKSARVTREVAARLAELAKSLEAAGYPAERVAQFLMRCVFTMFAEDVHLIREGGFTELLESLREEPHLFPEMVCSLWETMNTGGFSPILRQKLLRFNGGLFAAVDALPLTAPQLELLIQAAKSEWRDVEPAIFGTLLERALNPVERHKLGAHYTPRAYVERLVMPTVIEPLREEWTAVQAAALTADAGGDNKGAVEVVRGFHRKLCATRVLDPACGSGNFLYVTLEHLKRLEGEVLDLLNGLGQTHLDFEDEQLAVDPHQLLGIEINPRAAAIADLVLWIGYLQWHFRTRGETLPREPVLRNFKNIECRDAVLAYDGTETVLDEAGKPVTKWDGRTFKKHPVTGLDVPDETAQVTFLRHLNPHKSPWPESDYVIGNPPFIGNWRMRSALGDGYVEALRTTYADVPETADYVMIWWDRAADTARQGQTKRFGLITTNSLNQRFQRQIIDKHLGSSNPLSILFAIPDHPWVDSSEGASVRIAMTVACQGTREGVVASIIREGNVNQEEEREIHLTYRSGTVHSDLRLGANLPTASRLEANSKLSCPGVKLHGAGFIVSRDEALAINPNLSPHQIPLIRDFRNGRDLMSHSRGVMVIDAMGLTQADLRNQFPNIYQRLLERVKPERDQNNRQSYRDKWWVFGEPRSDFRPALSGLTRYIATTETAKHRVFVFLDIAVLPDNTIVAIALQDACWLGVLSSRVHTTWALAAGGRLGVGNDPRYNKSLCFERFPFPDLHANKRDLLRSLGEALDIHRKRQQAQHPRLTITDMYNVLEKLQAGEPLTGKDQTIHEQGLVSVLKQIHDDLDAAVFEAYGWPPTLTDEEILEKLVALNAERTREERAGKIRWLRPDYQNPAGAGQAALIEDAGTAPAVAASTKTVKRPWPKSLSDQASAVRAALATAGMPQSPEELAQGFQSSKTRVEKIGELLAMLAQLGQARTVDGGKYAA